MTLKSTIKDGRGSNNLAGVSTAGEIVLRGFGNNQSNNQSLVNNNQAYNLFPPLSGQTFVITTIIATFPTDNTSVTIFSAPSATSSTIDIELVTIAVVTHTTVVVTLPFGGFLSVGEGEFLNATKPAGGTIQITIVGFYIPV